MGVLLFSSLLFSWDQSKVVKTLVYKLKGNALLDHSDKLPDYADLFTKLVDDELAIVLDL
jgi:hypothetical protein